MLVGIFTLFPSNFFIDNTSAQYERNHNFVKYENPRFGYEIEYPAHWEFIPFPSSGSVLIDYPPIIPPGGDAREVSTISIGVKNLTTPISLEKYTADYIESRLKDSNVTIELSTITLRDDRIAHKVVVDLADGTKIMAIWTIDRNQLYVIAYDGGRNYDLRLPIFEKMINSFRIYR